MPPGVADRYARLVESTRVLRDFQSKPADQWKGNFLQRCIVERLLQKTVEAIIDLGNYLIAEKRWEKPRKAAEIFHTLAGHAVITRELATKMEKHVQNRNLLVHEYVTITPDSLVEMIGGLTELVEVAAALARELDLSTEI